MFSAKKVLVSMLVVVALFIGMPNLLYADAETEPNNSKLQADQLQPSTPMTGQLSSSADEDWFSFNISGQQIISVSFLQSSEHYGTDTHQITTYDSQNNILSSLVISSINLQTDFDVGLPAAGKYYIVITPTTDCKEPGYCDENALTKLYTLTVIYSATTTSTISNTTTTIEGCSYSISPLSQQFAAAGGSGIVNVTATDSSCSWQASSDDSWIIVTDSAGSGDGVVNYTVSKNSAKTSRAGTITIAGKTFAVNQEGAAVGCPTASILRGEPGHIKLIRDFRDKILLSRPEGRDYVIAYYQHSWELHQIIKNNPAIKGKATKLIHSVLPQIVCMLEGDEAEITPDVTKEADDLCGAIAAKARPALREAVEQLRNELKSGGLIESIGIRNN